MNRFQVNPEETAYYYTTCTIIDWLPVFQEDAYFLSIIDSLKYCREHKGLLLLAYVIMPTHLHLVTSNEDGICLPDIMRDFRRFTSRSIRHLLENNKRNVFLEIFKKAAVNRPGQEFKIWSDGFHPVALKSEKWLRQKIDYIHDNPVRKGFVEAAEDWKYSSARNWLREDDRIITIDRERL